MNRELFARRAPWFMLAFGLALAPFLYAARGERVHRGTTFDAALTLITADKPDLSCALPGVVAGFRCEYMTKGRAWPAGAAPTRVLQPFVTIRGVMYLVPNLFAEPALARRYAEELPDGRPRTHYRRFTAQCRLKLVERLPAGTPVRFGRNVAWGAAPAVWIAEASGCKLSDD